MRPSQKTNHAFNSEQKYATYWLSKFNIRARRKTFQEEVEELRKTSKISWTYACTLMGRAHCHMTGPAALFLG